MVLYHGTNVPFGEIDLAKGLPGKDFGRGFYMTDSLECAERTARQRADRLGGKPVVRRYELPDDSLVALNVKRFSAPCREWALFVQANRRSYVAAADHNRDNRYDVVIGPVANDKLSLQFRLFDKGLISLDAFVDGLRFSQLYMQYSFHTKAAIGRLKYAGEEDVRRD